MKYFLAFLATVGLIIVVILLIISGGNNSAPKKQATPQKNLVDYADTSAEMVTTVSGEINYDTLHRQMQVRVSRSQVKFIQIDGYSGQVTAQQTYPNNTNAYRNFLYALNFAGFNKGKSDKLTVDGRCALGYRYTYEIWENGQQLQKYWSTSCGGEKTYLGEVSKTQSLFKLQVPDYDTLSNNAGF